MDVDALVEGVLAGDRRAVARAISLVEDGAAELEALSAGIFAAHRAGRTIGLTGAPGVGKSTLAAELVRVRPRRVIGGRRARDRPDLAVHGRRAARRPGAHAGARDRSWRVHPLDGDARSPRRAWRSPRPRRCGSSTRPGTTASIVETVGVGQTEVDVAAPPTRRSSCWRPGMGDAVQMAKAGILEVADIFVVNKADRDGADEVAASSPDAHLGAARPGMPPVLATTARRAARDRRAVGGDRGPPRAPGGVAARSARSAAARLVREVEALRPSASGRGSRDAARRPTPTLADDLAARRIDPYRRRRCWSGAERPSGSGPREPMAAEVRRTTRPERDPDRSRRAAAEPVYAPEDLAGCDPGERRSARPGAYPFTRGIHPTMYRGRLWTMRQFAGFGTAEETNARYQFLLEHGQSGLSVAFDLPTLMGLDSDDPRSRGRGRALRRRDRSLADMETLFAGHPARRDLHVDDDQRPGRDPVRFFLAAAERQGVPWERLDGTLQNDILKEYIAQKEWVFPPRPHCRSSAT